jgi:hypothetical protein
MLFDLCVLIVKFVGTDIKTHDTSTTEFHPGDLSC